MTSSELMKVLPNPRSTRSFRSVCQDQALPAGDPNLVGPLSKSPDRYQTWKTKRLGQRQSIIEEIYKSVLSGAGIQTD